MQKNYKSIFFCILVLVCVSNLDAQTRTIYKDVLLNGKPAKLNVKTGEFTLIDSKGEDSIFSARKKNNASLNSLNYHIVKPGETLFKLSEQYGLSLNKLKEANNLQTTLVTVGQKIRVRNFDEVLLGSSDQVWVVLKGHTLYHISTKTGVSIATLKRLNGLRNNNITVGQKLNLK